MRVRLVVEVHQDAASSDRVLDDVRHEARPVVHPLGGGGQDGGVLKVVVDDDVEPVAGHELRRRGSGQRGARHSRQDVLNLVCAVVEHGRQESGLAAQGAGGLTCTTCRNRW